MTDPIADMFTRLRNGAMARKKEVVVPFSKLKLGIAQILARHGYLAGVEEKKDIHPYILLMLKYNGIDSAIGSIKRVSTPGHRCYVKAGEIKRVLNGYGLAILSTPRGLMTDSEARKAKVGGELICEIY